MNSPPEVQSGYRKNPEVLVGVGFLLVLALFWPTLASFPATWARYGMYHGWAVAGFVIWLVWRDRDQLLKGTTGHPGAMLPLVTFSLLWFASTVAHIQLFHQTAFLLLVLCWGFVVLGHGAVRTLVGVGLTFSLALPVWEVLVPILRPITTITSAFLVRMLGISTEIEGDLIHIGAGSFLIADGCAGLSYFLAGMVIGVCYALIFLKRWRSRIAVVCLAAAISIVGNWVRVAAVIVIGHVTEMQSGIIENHGSLGWVIFTVSLVPFFILAGRIEKGASGPGGDRETESVSESTESDIEPGENRGMGNPGNLLKRVASASALAVMGPILYIVIGALPVVDNVEMIPGDLALGDLWHREVSPGDRPFNWRPGYQGAEQEDSWSFTDGSAHVYVDRFVYRKQAQGAKLVGYPNSIAGNSEVLEDRLVGPVDPARSRWIRQAVVRTQDGPILAWYWYRVGGVNTFSPVYAKILEVPAFLTRRRASELIALSAACEPDNCENALDVLREFMGGGTEVAPGNPSGHD